MKNLFKNKEELMSSDLASVRNITLTVNPLKVRVCKLGIDGDVRNSKVMQCGIL